MKKNPTIMPSHLDYGMQKRSCLVVTITYAFILGGIQIHTLNVPMYIIPSLDLYSIDTSRQYPVNPSCPKSPLIAFDTNKFCSLPSIRPCSMHSCN